MPFTVEDIHQAVLSQINGLNAHSLDFLFSPNHPPYRNRDSLYNGFQEEWKTAKQWLVDEERRRKIVNIMFPGAPYDLTVISILHDLFLHPPSPRPFIFFDICIGKMLLETVGRYGKLVSPQLFVELMNFYRFRTPEFLIAIDPITRIVLDRENNINHVIKSHACEVLINNYESEALFIFISRNTQLTEVEKQVLFQSLTAFQKIYRKFLELRVGITEKDLISLHWFGVSYTQLRQQRELRDTFSNLVKRFIACLKEKDEKGALRIGRFLVLSFNNEDILRAVHYEINAEPDLSLEGPLAHFVYHQTFKIMQEFRKSYISQKVDAELTQAISETEARTIDAMRMVTIGKVPASVVANRLRKGDHLLKDYPILPEFMDKLNAFNLQALFELYPIPPLSQQVCNLVANIAQNIDLDHDQLFHFIAYVEKLLVLLQRFTETGISIERGSLYGLIKNPYQLQSLNLIKEGAYFMSTGLWYQNTIPPSVIRCISPNAIPNCLGVKDRHIFCRISLLTGGFRGRPFDLDGTNRYDWDEEDEACLFRPGYTLISIPRAVLEQWNETQDMQKSALKELIREKKWN